MAGVWTGKMGCLH